VRVQPESLRKRPATIASVLYVGGHNCQNNTWMPSGSDPARLLVLALLHAQLNMTVPTSISTLSRQHNSLQPFNAMKDLRSADGLVGSLLAHLPA
jgi:hypothetical protein